MKEHVLRREQVLEAPIEQAFEFFSRAENLEAITPPWLRFRITSPTPIEMHVGALIRYRLALRRIPISWLTRIEEWEPPHRFVDMQLRGPYGLWHHTHTFEPADERRPHPDDVTSSATGSASGLPASSRRSCSSSATSSASSTTVAMRSRS